MNISSNERIMYSIMKVIYESGLPISFKGSMVLKACLYEAGYMDEVRHTEDIDANWLSNYQPSMEDIEKSLQETLDKQKINMKVVAFRDYGNGRSAGFRFINDLNEPIFKIDMDINRSNPSLKLYTIEGIHFKGVSPYQMMADKVCAVSSDKVFRRIKDVIDLYYFSKVFEFDTEKIMSIITESGKTLGTFDGFLNRIDDLKHAYVSFRLNGIENKLPFEEIYNAAKSFINDILPK